MTPGFVYILTNPAMPGLVKIGVAFESVEARAAALSAATGVPLPFEVQHSRRFKVPYAAEHAMHLRLAGCRVSQAREFFKVSADEARRALEEIPDTSTVKEPVDRPIQIDPAMREAKRRVGGNTALAGLLGDVTPQGVSQWRRAPAGRVLQIEQVTGVSRHLLRPDVYGPAPSNSEAA